MNSNTTYSYRPDTVSTREDYERLSEDTMYRHDYLPTKSNKPIDKLVRKINLNIGRGRDGTYSASLRYIVSNVLLAAQKNYYGFRMNVSNNSYDSAVLLGRKGFRTVADALAAQGFLNIIPGRSFQGQSRSGYESEDVRNFSTAFLFTEKLLDLIQDEIDSYSVPKSFVQMKDRETGEQIRVNMKDERFQHVNTILAKMNSISGLGRITYAGVIQRRMDYTAIYSAQRDNGDVQVTGGRIYAKHKFQCFESATRLEKIRIDGCSCTEIDFASMHINLILEQLRAAGHEVDQYRGIDPYVLEGLTLYRYDRLYNECEGIEKPLQRKVIKTIVNTLINCKDQEQSIKTVTSTLIDNSLLYFPHRVQEIKDAILRRSPFIEPYICADAGLKLQGIDAKIALEVINTFNEMDEVCLPYHDSFIVRHDLQAELDNAMKSAWLKVMGDDKFCAITIK